MFDWKQEKLGNFAELFIGGGTPATSRESFWNGEIPWIQSSDITLNKMWKFNPKHFISESAINNSSAKLIPGNSISIVTRVGVGKLVYSPVPYSTSQDFLSLSNLNIDFRFGMYVLYNILKKVETQLQGTSIKGVTKADLLITRSSIPESQEEQTKIGKLFFQLDNAITLHEEKLAKLKQLKQGFLQKMFADESGKPVIRFKGFNDDWEQRRLGEVVERETCQVISSDDNPSVEYDDVVSEQGKLNKNVLAKRSVKKGIQFNKNHILYGKLRPYLHNWLNPNFKGVAVGDWWVLKPKNDIKKAFLYALIQTQRYDNVANISTGSKMPRADWNLVSNTNFAIPSQLDEQLKIGEAFSQLDSLITFQQRKLNQLKNLKKSLLQNMFI